MKLTASILGILFVACASTMTPRANSRDEIVAYVDRAARLVQANGPSCETFAGPRWLSGDWYIFVFDGDGKTICHPVRPDLVGASNLTIVDANGKRVGEEMRQIAASAGSGWVEYVWARPGQTAPEPKSTYVQRTVGPDGKVYVVGSGGYGVPR